ncbi:MAG TPA: acyltransferase family protein, partial [Candidatus Binatia bacterium]|nr:acyltransferase family protein [Candidatus Binatia bacterium]
MSNRSVGFVKYNPCLDGIRGFAVLGLAASHAGYIVGGHYGVDVFFVLSGFLITSLLLQEWAATNGLSFTRFYLRRLLRLGPALLALIAAAIMYESLFPQPGDIDLRWRLIFVALYVVNWVWAFNPSVYLGGLGAFAP